MTPQILFEALPIVTTAFMVGVFLAFISRMKRTEHLLLRYNREIINNCKTDMIKTKQELVRQVKDFEEVTKQASEANNSLGTLLSDIQNKQTQMNDRINMIQSQSGAKSTWNM